MQNSPSSVDLAQIFEPIREDLEAVEREFVEHIQSRVALIPEMGRYIQNSGGKRVRPAVLLMAARLSGYQGNRAVLYASVVEFIHTATLVHDDIIDGADLRRGRLAVHSRWGNDITVLLGDYLYAQGLVRLSAAGSVEAVADMGELISLCAQLRAEGTGARYGASVSVRNRPAGTNLATARIPSARGNVRMPANER